MKLIKIQIPMVAMIIGIITIINCSDKKENNSQQQSFLTALTTNNGASANPRIPAVPANFDFSTVKNNKIEIQNIPVSNGIAKPFLTIALKSDFSEKVYSGFITAGETFSVPLVVSNSVDILYFRLYSGMQTGTSGTLIRSNNSFILNQ